MPPPGLKNQWGVNDPAPVCSDKQGKDFQAAFQKLIAPINEHLQYTVSHAEEEKHNPLAAKRDGLMTAFQGALAKVDPADPSKAQPAIDKVLADGQALSGEVSKFRAEAEKAFNDWTAREPKHEKAVQQVEELENWDHPKESALRGLVDGIRKETDKRRYAPACTTFDQLLPKLKTIYDEYLKQKEAKAKYDPALAALQPRLGKVAQCKSAKVAQMQQDITTVQGEMEAAAQSKNYVDALTKVTDLGPKLDAYEAAVKDLEEKKAAYEEALAKLEPRFPNGAQPSEKLEAMATEINTLRGQMETAAKGEDYEGALKFTGDLTTKLDALEAAKKELDEKKKAYEAALAPLTPRLGKVEQCQSTKLEPMQKDIITMKGDMEKAAADGDFEQALKVATELGPKLDAYEMEVKNFELKKKAFDDAFAALQPNLAKAVEPKEGKLAPEQEEIVGVQKKMEAAVAAGDYDEAAKVLADLSIKVDAYNKKAAAAGGGGGGGGAAGDKDKPDDEKDKGDAVKMVIPVEKTFKLASPVKLKGALCKVSAQLTINLKGSLEVASTKDPASRSTDIGPLGYADGLVLRVGETWYHEKGAKILGIETTIVETKIVGEAKVKDGIEFSLAGSAKFANGEELEIKFIVVKVEEKEGVSGPGAEVSYAFKAFTIEQKVDTVTFAGTLQLSLAGTAEPDWVAIGEEIAKRIAPRAAQIAASVLTVDVIIVAGFAAGAVMTIFAAYKGIAQGSEIRGLTPLVNKATNEFSDAYIAGFQGGGGGGAAAAASAMGAAAYAKLKAQIASKVPDVTDQEIREAANIGSKRDFVGGQVNPLAKQAIWQAFAEANRGDHGMLWKGHTNIFGGYKDSDLEPYLKD